MLKDRITEFFQKEKLRRSSSRFNFRKRFKRILMLLCFYTFCFHTPFLHIEDTLRARATREKVVILTAITHQYQEFFESLFCNLQKVGGSEHLVVAALDRSTLHWGLRKQYPVIYSRKHANSWLKLENSDVTFGTNLYKSTTKFKSRIVLDILKAGYSVIFMDPDVIWFANPIEAISNYWHDDIVIQSDTKVVTYPLQAVNSGLYAVKSTKATVSAFTDIVKSARYADTSEQPHFRRNLCQLEKNETVCIYKHKVRLGKTLKCNVATLPMESFPNGGVKFTNRTFFEIGPKSFRSAVQAPLYAVHNNWIKGLDNKKRRQLSWDLWWSMDSCDT